MPRATILIYVAQNISWDSLVFHCSITSLSSSIKVFFPHRNHRSPFHSLWKWFWEQIWGGLSNLVCYYLFMPILLSHSMVCVIVKYLPRVHQEAYGHTEDKNSFALTFICIWIFTYLTILFLPSFLELLGAHEALGKFNKWIYLDLLLKLSVDISL